MTTQNVLCILGNPFIAGGFCLPFIISILYILVFNADINTYIGVCIYTYYYIGVCIYTPMYVCI